MTVSTSASVMLKKSGRRTSFSVSSSYIDSAGNYDHDLYELAQLMVDARKRVTRIKKYRREHPGAS